MWIDVIYDDNTSSCVHVDVDVFMWIGVIYDDNNLWFSLSTSSSSIEKEEVERTSGSVSSEEEDEDISRNAMVKMRRQQSDNGAEVTMLKGCGIGSA